MTLQARFFDGKTSKAHAAALRLTSDCMLIQVAAESTPLRWYLRDLHNQDEYIKGRALTLGNRTDPQAHLVIEDQEMIGRILRLLPRRQRSMSAIPVSLIVVLGLFLLSGLCLAGAVWLVKNKAASVAAMIPAAWEQTLAENMVPQLDEAKTYAEKYPCRANAQTQILKTLLAKLPAGKDVTIFVSPDKEINAFALPGDMIVVNQGLIDFVENEHELLGVLAHERAHIEHKHVMQSVVHALGLRIIFIVMTGGDSDQLAAIGAQIFQMGYSRDHEREADRSAVIALQKAGLSAAPLAAFFDRLEKKEKLMQELSKYELFGYLSSHPLMKERIELLAPGQTDKEIALKPLLATGEFSRLKSLKTLDCNNAGR